jgi:hypothetical protein
VKALTVWQPWATLIVAGAKPYEFRRWDFGARFPSLIGERIAIHAGARPMRAEEVNDILDRIDEGESALDVEKALPILKFIGKTAAEDEKKAPRCLPLGAVLGTAILGQPANSFELFKDKVADSSRLDHSIFAWPLTDIVQFDQPVEYRGAQGFWNFPEALAR